MNRQQADSFLGSATWLLGCTRLGFPVSTTQSIVGALVGVGIALDINVNWGWKKGSVSQIAASWGIAPAIACGFGAIIMMSIKLLVHQRKDPLKAAIRVISFYYGKITFELIVRHIPSDLLITGLTAGILALFVVISGGHGIPTIEEQGAGQVIGIVLGVFFGISALSAIFPLPYFYRKYVAQTFGTSLVNTEYADNITDSLKVTVA